MTERRRMRGAWVAFLSGALALVAGAACSDGNSTATTAAPSASVVVVASASAKSTTPPPGCPKIVSALGMDRGFPVVAPSSQTELDAALKELELRVSAFEKVRGELDPESLRVGGELAASFTDLAEAMKRKRPPSESAETLPPASEPSPAEDRPRRMPAVTASASAPRPHARGSASPSSSAGLYDTSGWDQKNERFIAAWKAVATLCP